MDKDKLTPEQQFFNDKTLEFAEELYDQSEEKLKEAYNGQIKNRDELLSKIAKILLSYNIADNILKLNAAEKKKLYLELSDLIVANIKKELNFETDLTKDILTNVSREKYNTNNYVYSLGADFKITQLDDKALKKIINTKVDDKLWSDRLYDNKNEMCNVLQTEVEKFLKGETNVNKIEQKIIEKYDTNAHETKRLVQDNICRVQEGANDQWQHEHDIEYVMYMATLDGKVCHRCAQYDSKVYELDKKPVLIPRHPFCRCVYISLPNKDWHPKMRLDNETKKNINWQSYEDWKKNYIDNNPERLLNHKMIKNKSSDKKQHEKYKNVLGDEVPKTLEEFQKMKYNDTNKWNQLKSKYNLDLNIWDGKKVSGDYKYNSNGRRVAKASDIKNVKNYLSKHNLGFSIDTKNKKLPSFAAGGFNPNTGEIVLRENPTYLSLRHEFFHAEQYVNLGKEKYLLQTSLQREEHVYSQIMKHRNEFNADEIYSAQSYIYSLRNGENPPPNWKGY